MRQPERQEEGAGDLKSRWITMVNEYSTDPVQTEVLTKLDVGNPFDRVLIQMVMRSRNALQFIGQLELDDSRFSGRDISDLEEPYKSIVDLLTDRAARARKSVAHVMNEGRSGDMLGGGAE